jgi:hypothetical protein
MKKILLIAAVMFAFATPDFAQSYSAIYGTGNLIDTPLLEKTNRTYGYFGTRRAIGGHSSCSDRSRSKRNLGIRLFAADFPPAQSER